MYGVFDVDLKDFVRIACGRTRNSVDAFKLYPVHRRRTSLFRDSFFNRIVIIGTISQFIYVNHPLSSRLNLVLMSTILTNFLVHLTVTGRVRGRQYVPTLGLLEILVVKISICM